MLPESLTAPAHPIRQYVSKDLRLRISDLGSAPSRSGRPRTGDRPATPHRPTCTAAGPRNRPDPRRHLRRNPPRAPVPCGRNWKYGDSSSLSYLSWWRNLAGRRPKSHAAGMAKVCADRWRSNTAMGASPRRNCALWWCIRVNWRSSKPKPMPLPKRKKPQPWPTTGGMCTPGGLPACPMPKRLSPSMRAKGRGTEGAGPVPGGITPSAIASWQTPAARAGPDGDDPQRLTYRRSSRAIVWWLRLRPWPMLKRTMGGRCWPRR